MTVELEKQLSYLILAGGQGKRMQGLDKGLMSWKNRPMIEHVLQQLNPQNAPLIISANRNQSHYQQYTRQIVEDQFDDFQGPLAGLLAAMQACSTPYILCVPCDSPDPPQQLAEKLWGCMHEQHKSAAICHDGERKQPLFALLACEHKNALSEYLQQGQRKVHEFMTLIDAAICDFSDQKTHFVNFNRPTDMQ